MKSSGFSDIILRISAYFHQISNNNANKLVSPTANCCVFCNLQANHHKLENTVKTLVQNLAFRKTYLPAQYSEKIANFLQSGLIYLHGRDCAFRPLIFMSIYRINMQNVEIDTLLRGLSFVLEFAKENLMLPGQVESWVFVVDLGNMGLFNLPLAVKYAFFNEFCEYIIGFF